MRWTLLIISAYALPSLCAFWAHRIDKRRAGAGRRRLRERTLHLWSLAGGWPGAAMARRRFRHKTRDRKFLAVEHLIVALHLGVWLLALWLWLTRSD